MTTQDDVRRIALALPGVEENRERFAFHVLNRGKPKGICWVWLERIEPRKPRIPNPSVLAVRTENVVQRDLMIESDGRKFFTEPHYNGYPAVLVRLGEIGVDELEGLMADAWQICTSTRRGR